MSIITGIIIYICAYVLSYFFGIVLWVKVEKLDLESGDAVAFAFVSFIPFLAPILFGSKALINYLCKGEPIWRAKSEKE